MVEVSIFLDQCNMIIANFIVGFFHCRIALKLSFIIFNVLAFVLNDGLFPTNRNTTIFTQQRIELEKTFQMAQQWGRKTKYTRFGLAVAVLVQPSEQQPFFLSCTTAELLFSSLDSHRHQRSPFLECI
jgi:hypothetical protein